MPPTLSEPAGHAPTSFLLPAASLVDPMQPIHVFWDEYGRRLGERHIDTCKAVCARLMEEHGCVTVGCMATLSFDELETAIEAAGGKAGWIKSIGKLICHEFVPSHNIPAAALVSFGNQENIDPNNYQKNKQRFAEGEEKYGFFLKRTGQLNKVSLPRARLLAVCKETKDPTAITTRLRSNDTVAVALEVMLWSAIEHGYLGGDKEWVNHIASLLYAIFPNPWKSTWYKIIHNRLETARRSGASVRAAHPDAPCLLSIHLTSSLRFPCAHSQ